MMILLEPLIRKSVSSCSISSPAHVFRPFCNAEAAKLQAALPPPQHPGISLLPAHIFRASPDRKVVILNFQARVTPGRFSVFVSSSSPFRLLSFNDAKGLLSDTLEEFKEEIQNATMIILDLSECNIFDEDLPNVVKMVEAVRSANSHSPSTGCKLLLSLAGNRLLAPDHDIFALARSCKFVDVQGCAFSSVDRRDFFHANIKDVADQLIFIPKGWVDTDVWHLFVGVAPVDKAMVGRVQCAHREYYKIRSTYL